MCFYVYIHIYINSYITKNTPNNKNTYIYPHTPPQKKEACLIRHTPFHTPVTFT